MVVMPKSLRKKQNCDDAKKWITRGSKTKNQTVQYNAVLVVLKRSTQVIDDQKQNTKKKLKK